MAQPPVTSQARGRRLIVAGVFLSLLLLYVGTARLTMIHGDDRSMFQVTASLVDRRDIALPDPPAEAGLTYGLDARPYSKYGIGLSLVAAPLYWAGSRFYDLAADRLTRRDRQTVLVAVVMLTNPLLTAATAAALWLLVVRLCFGVGPATAAALLYGTTTFAWHYAADTFFSEPLAGLCLLVAVTAAWRAQPGADRRWLLVGGFAAGLLVATRPFNVMVVPILFGYLLWQRRRPARDLLVWLAPLAAWGLLIALYNYARFGNIFETGYGGEAQSFSTPLITGVTGLLITPGKGLVFYSPILLLSLVGVRPLWRRDRALTVVVGVIFLAHLVGYGTFLTWWGGGSWGPRFLLPVVPLLTLALAAGLRPIWRTRWTRLALVGLATLSLVIQASSVLIDFGVYWTILQLYYRTVAGSSPWDFVSSHVYDPWYSPIVAHLWQLFTGRPWIVAGAAFGSTRLLVAQVAAIALAAALMLGVVGLARIQSGIGRPAERR